MWGVAGLEAVQTQGLHARQPGCRLRRECMERLDRLLAFVRDWHTDAHAHHHHIPIRERRRVSRDFGVQELPGHHVPGRLRRESMEQLECVFAGLWDGHADAHAHRHHVSRQRRNGLSQRFERIAELQHASLRSRGRRLRCERLWRLGRVLQRLWPRHADAHAHRHHASHQRRTILPGAEPVAELPGHHVPGRLRRQ